MGPDEILDKTKEVVTRNRQQLYGPPERNFARISFLWSQFLDVNVEPHEVAICLALVKIARINTSPEHIDNYIDLAGYAALAGELADNVRHSDSMKPEPNPSIPHGITGQDGA